MSDIAFNPVMSTNEIFRANDRTRFLRNDLDTIETDIQDLEELAVSYECQFECPVERRQLFESRADDYPK